MFLTFDTRYRDETKEKLLSSLVFIRTQSAYQFSDIPGRYLFHIRPTPNTSMAESADLGLGLVLTLELCETDPLHGLDLSEMSARHEDEKDAEGNSYSSKHKEGHRSARPEESSDKWLSHSRPAHKRVFAEAEEGRDQIELVLVTDQEVGADCEGKDELKVVSQSLGFCIKFRSSPSI